MAINIDNLINKVTAGNDTSSKSTVSVSSGTAATTKSKSGALV